MDNVDATGVDDGIGIGAEDVGIVAKTATERVGTGAAVQYVAIGSFR